MQSMIGYTLLRYILLLAVTLFFACGGNSSSSVVPTEQYIDETTNVQFTLPPGFTAKEDNSVLSSTFKDGDKMIIIKSSSNTNSSAELPEEISICNINGSSLHIGSHTITDEKGSLTVETNTYSSEVVISDILYELTYKYTDTKDHEELYTQFTGSCPDLSEQLRPLFSRGYG